MDKCLKDKAHFIIAQTIWNNKNGKAVFAEQVFDRCRKLFQNEINDELYKLIEEVTFINEFKPNSLQGFCFMCTKLNKINGIIDVSGVTNTNQFLDGNGAKFISEVWIKNLSTSIYITSPNFTKECCLYMFNNATTVTSNIVVALNDVVYNNLTADERAILTNKGFTLRGGITN